MNKRKARVNSISSDSFKCLKDLSTGYYEINMDEKTAKCKLCDGLVDIIHDSVPKHRLEGGYDDHKDHGKLRSELANYGKENYIKLNEGGKKTYCLLCDMYLAPHIRVAKDHVNGARHKAFLELKGLIPSKKYSMPMCNVQNVQHFIKDMFYMQSLNAFCLNHTIPVDGLSFMFIAVVFNNKLPKKKCFCCDMTFEMEHLSDHLATKTHKDAIIASKVVLIEEEFIRIIRSKLYHCGFCNKVFPFWDAMDKHCSSWDHTHSKKKKMFAYMLTMKAYAEHKRTGNIRVMYDLYQKLLDVDML